jgi:outer membrane protein assembly factor BamB
MNKEQKITQYRTIAIIAAVFTGLVSLLMMLNYMQISASDPLESQTLKMLVARLSADPGNHELMEEIRQLDLLVRKAYFNSIWQIRTGAWLLIIGAIVLITALRAYLNLRFTIEKPTEEAIKAKKIRQISQRWIGIAGLAILLLAGLSAIFSIDHLQQFETGQLVSSRMQTEEGIVQYDITTADTAFSTADTSLTAEGNEATDTSDGDIAGESNDGTLEGTPTAGTKAIIPLTAETVRQNHNAFRGAWGNGVSAHRNIPTDWDGASGKNIIWKTLLPLHGYNSPIVWGDKIFLSAASPAKRLVLCLDKQSGKILWEREVNNIPGSPATPPKTTEDTGLAAPTLTTDGQRVFAVFGTGDIIAFDFAGNRLWAKNLGVPSNHYGHSSSLLTWDGKVFVQYDTQAGSRVMALDNNTGQTVWETKRTDGVSWASPMIARVNNTYQLILSANPSVSAYDTGTGKELWRLNCMSGEVGPSPTFGGGLIYAANEYAKIVAINPTNGALVWEDNYYLPEVSSPLYHNGLLYIATSYAVFACFDATTGEFLWEFDADNGFYSSPMLADGKIYILDLEGQAYIFNPGKEMQLISSPHLGEKVFATPVFSDGRLYVRGNRHLYAVGN